jgi:hypothetical protein
MAGGKGGGGAVTKRINDWLEGLPGWLGALLFVLFGLLVTVVLPALVELPW